MKNLCKSKTKKKKKIISLLTFYLPFYFPILDSRLVLLVTFWLFRKINKNLPLHPRPNFTSCAVFLRGRRESDKTDDEKHSAMPHTKTTDKLFIIEPQAAQAK